MQFPKHIDNTILAAAKMCLTKARYAFFEDLALPGESVHLIFGAAMASGLEAGRRAFHDQRLNAEDAVEVGAQKAWDVYGEYEPPHKSPKTREAAADAVRYYFTIWPLDRDPMQPTRGPGGDLRVEWRFRVPIPDLVHPDDGGEIYLVGRSDMIPDLNGMVIIEDDKSAGSLGEKWPKQWPLDSQFMGYIWAAQNDGILVPKKPGTAMIRGVGVYTRKYYRRDKPDVMLKKVTQDMIDSGEAVYSLMDSFGHSQAIVHHTPFMIERWLRETQRVIRRLIYAYINDPDNNKGAWDLALDKHACAPYNDPCPYTELCSSENPDKWKEINFVRRKWDPLATI